MLARLLILIGCLPVSMMLISVLTGLELADYSHVTQHMSELQLRDDYTYWSIKITAGLSGVFLVAFTVLFTITARRFSFAALTALCFGIGMMSNGIFDIGSPLHGLMGIVMLSALTPALFVAEFPNWSRSPWFKQASLLIAVINLTYFWVLIVGLEPEATRGLTQRAASLILFGWYALAGLQIAAALKADGPAKAPTA